MSGWVITTHLDEGIPVPKRFVLPMICVFARSKRNCALSSLIEASLLMDCLTEGSSADIYSVKAEA